MKRCLLVLTALLLCLLMSAAQAEVPAYTVENNVIVIDLDGDGLAEQVELTRADEEGMSYVTLNVSRQNVLISHMRLLSCMSDSQTQIKVYPLRVKEKNYLYIETHATGSESLYSTWMIAGFSDSAICFHAFMSDPGWTSGTALYDGNDPVDAETYLAYSADYDSFDEQSYLNVLRVKFAYYDIDFFFESLPFTGWYSAAVLMPAPNLVCALDVSHKQLTGQLTQSNSAESAAGDKLSMYADFKIKITGNLHLRAGAGLDYKDLGVIAKGANVNYLGESRIDGRGVVWHYVSTNLGIGWISGKYSENEYIDKLIPSSLSGEAESTASIHVRALPDIHSKALGVVSKGTKLAFLNTICVDERGVAWFKVSFSGGDAWISSKYSALN